MPILIRELHIKVTVNDTANATALPAGQVANGPREADPEGNERIVEECVEQVLAILRNRWAEK